MRILIAVALLAACGQMPTHEASAPSNPLAIAELAHAAPVTDASAPTVADLQRRGLTEVGYEPAAGPDCGPDCTADAMSAIYMGKETRRFPPDRQFICAVASGKTESWKCRPLGAANG